VPQRRPLSIAKRTLLSTAPTGGFGRFSVLCKVDRQVVGQSSYQPGDDGFTGQAESELARVWYDGGYALSRTGVALTEMATLARSSILDSRLRENDGVGRL
jgi:hypothetical protein